MTGYRYNPTINDYIKLATLMCESAPISKITKELNLSRYCVKAYFAESLDGYSPKRKEREGGKEKDTSRDVNMCNMFKSGLTLEEIGKKYGISRERVRQILKRYDITRRDGGQAIRARERMRSKAIRHKKKADKLKRESLGCDLNEWKYYRSFNKDYYKTPIHAYIQQRSNSRSRDIAWNITINEWWSVWEASGKWGERGVGKDLYVMGRHGDLGSYEIGNVKIITMSENSREYYDLHMDEWRQKMIDAHGWEE